MRRIIKKPIVLILLSALISAIPFTFSSLFFLSYISFIPLFYVLISKSGNKIRYAVGWGISFGFLYHLLIYYWFLAFHPMEYAGFSNSTSIAVVLLAWIGISFVHGVLWCIPAICCHVAVKVIKNPLFIAAIAVLGIIAAEKLTQISELAFPWVRVALGQYRVPVLIQSASLFGIDGVDMLILSINALLTLTLLYPPKKRTIAAVSAVLIFSINLIFGICRLQTEDYGESFEIMTVQGNVEASEKWTEGSEGIVFCYDTYTELTKKYLNDSTELVIWPESAVPINLYLFSGFLDLYKDFVKEIEIPLLTGALWQVDGKRANIAIMIDGDNVSDPYIKRKIVPFGEYMPYRTVLEKLFPPLTEINVLGEDYVAGRSTVIMQTELGNIGNVICFEITYPSLTRKSVRDGAELIVEVTNDSWLKDSTGVWQHMAHGVFRSIENSRYLVCSANSGVSAVFDSRGRIKSELGPLEQGVLCDTVYLSQENTLYSLIGDVLFPACVGLIILWGIVEYRKLIDLCLAF